MNALEPHILSEDASLKLQTLYGEFGKEGESIDDFASRAFRSAGLELAATNGGELASYRTVLPEQPKTDDGATPLATL